MEFLRLLESIRIPALNVFFSGITYCGDEIAFMVVAFALFWCVNKRTGYYAFLVGLFGTVGNQWLKIACRIPRPWVLDPNFTIVESARAAATGYSFPSGHTQNAVGTFGAMALRTERKWVRGVCIALIVLVPFSRMYLGVHTPLDVGVAFLMAAALLALFYPVFRSEQAMAKGMPWLLSAAVLLAVAFTFYMGGLRVDAASAAWAGMAGTGRSGCRAAAAGTGPRRGIRPGTEPAASHSRSSGRWSYSCCMDSYHHSYCIESVSLCYQHYMPRRAHRCACNSAVSALYSLIPRNQEEFHEKAHLRAACCAAARCARPCGG